MSSGMFSGGGRPVIMGILNVTPDSFSDGGDFFATDAAIAHGLRMAGDGADIIDVGGESTRPGAQRVSAAEQIRRVVPVIAGLKKNLPEQVVISVDTTLTEVVHAACTAGATMINDISAGEDDAALFRLAAAHGIPLVLMHKLGTPATMQQNPVYTNVVAEIRSYLLERADAAVRAGIKRENLILDPGFGFGKSLDHNLQLLAHLESFTSTGMPILIGASRKSFLSGLCHEENRKKLAGASCAVTVIGVLAGVKLFRVHDVKENRQAAEVAYAAVARRQE
jgi:dihydropteroate synthase